MGRKASNPPQQAANEKGGTSLRLVGGQFRGRRLKYSGDRRVRPMKDRVREAMFNLIGPAVRGMHAIDLFAGTGALGLEAISRGAAGSTFVERHYPTAAILDENIAALDCAEVCHIHRADTFIWSHNLTELPATPWLVLCSPPYDFYVERTGEMMDLVSRLIEACPAGSILALEADERFDFTQLPQPEAWDVRAYPPAVIGILTVK